MKSHRPMFGQSLVPIGVPLGDVLDRVRRTKPLPLVAMNAVLAQALEREVRAVLASLVPSRTTP